METFGSFIKRQRIMKRITLRDFCRRANIDPSNWSKIERGLLQPPKSKEVLGQIAGSLEIAEDSEEWNTMCDLTVIAHVPVELISEEAILANLPILFRTLRGQKPTTEELEELINIIGQS